MSAPTGTPTQWSWRRTSTSDLGRWRWLVKWFLAIPHFVVLDLPVDRVRRPDRRGRHLDRVHGPLSTLDLRLQRRRPALDVAGAALRLHAATDRYPPFSLDVEADYPAVWTSSTPSICRAGSCG